MRPKRERDYKEEEENIIIVVCCVFEPIRKRILAPSSFRGQEKMCKKKKNKIFFFCSCHRSPQAFVYYTALHRVRITCRWASVTGRGVDIQTRPRIDAKLLVGLSEEREKNVGIDLFFLFQSFQNVNFSSPFFFLFYFLG